MAADPRQFTVKPCPKDNQFRINSQNARRSFFSQLGKIGDIQALNDIKGLDNVGKGLRVLSSVSNSIRVGQGSLPTVIGQSLDTGANWVLGQMGFDANTLSALNNFSPQMVNQAYGQAKAIYTNIQQGNFDLSQIPFYLQNFQNLERLVRNIFVPGENKSAAKAFCEASPYAVDLITTRSPKYKFLFVVEFIFNGDYANALKGVNNTFAFTVQTSTRPKLQYHMEDLNLYNFRTKIITKTSWEDMTMTFYDDQTNVALDFYNTYMKSTVPISNYLTPTEAAISFDDGGMFFQTKNLGVTPTVDSDLNISQMTYPYSAGSYMPPLMTTDKNIIREIKLYEVFNWGRYFNVYRFMNPRIAQLQLDDMDMSAGNTGMMFNINFNFDSVGIVTNQDMSVLGAQNSSAPGDPKQLTRNGLYPLQYVGQTSSPVKPNTGNGIRPNPNNSVFGTAEAWRTPPFIPQSVNSPIPTVFDNASSAPQTVANFDFGPPVNTLANQAAEIAASADFGSPTISPDDTLPSI